MSDFPKIPNLREFRIAVDEAFENLVGEYGEALEYATLPIYDTLQLVEDFFLWLPWYVVLLVVGVLAYFASNRSWKLACGLCFLGFLIGFIGLWEPAMETMALMLTSTLFSISIGIPIGILMSRSDRMQSAVLPILDIMQTMPIFVYLIPFVMLLGPGKVPALLATIVFAVPPVIRLTNLGIRHVDFDVVEAYTSFGATPNQALWHVQIPLALPSIMAGINQTTMMALSMVVIASMIGAGGIGLEVLQGIQRLEISKGLLSGLAIVFLAVIFDRIAQSYGKKMQSHLEH